MNVVTMFVPLAHFRAVAHPDTIRPLRGAQNAVTLAIPVLIAAGIKVNRAAVTAVLRAPAAVKHAMIVPH